MYADEQVLEKPIPNSFGSLTIWMKKIKCEKDTIQDEIIYLIQLFLELLVIKLLER